MLKRDHTYLCNHVITVEATTTATENAAIVSYARSQLAVLGTLDTPEFTFSLPDLSVYPGILLMLKCVSHSSQP